MATEGVESNIDEFMQAIATLRESLPKAAAVAGTRKALVVMGRELRSTVNAWPASARMKRSAKTAIGWRFVKGGIDRLGKSTEPIAKAGFGVGKQSKAQRAKKESSRLKKRGKRAKSEQGGAGIGSPNIHWPILGTQQRKTGKRNTGRMPDVLRGLVAKAVASGGPQAIQAFSDASQTQLEKEVARVRLKQGK